MPHDKPHRWYGLTAKTARDDLPFAGEPLHVVDWFDRLHDNSWMMHSRFAPAMVYAMRSQFKMFPLDEVVQVIVGRGIFLFHDSELVMEANK